MMKRFSLTHFATAAMLVSAGLMIGAALTPRPAQAGNNGKGGGGGNGGGGNETTPAVITIDNSYDDGSVPSEPPEIVSVGGSYETNAPPPLEVFVGSAANDGNIRLKGNSSGREIGITVPQPNDCNLPSGEFEFQFLKVDVGSVVSGGVHGISPGVTEAAPMRIRFADNGQMYFLNFNPGESCACRNKSGGLAQVTGVSATSWTVTNGGSTACIEKHQPKGKNDLCIEFVEMDFSFDAVEQ